MITINTCGEPCPRPLIITKQAIDQAGENKLMTILTDNDTSKCNLQNWLQEMGIDVKESFNNGVFALQITTPASTSSVDTACALPSSSHSQYVVAITGESFGRGNDDLGKLLMRAFINTLPQASSLPTHILLYNSGVLFAAKGNDTVKALQLLEENGVTILVCGTCADFFAIKEQLEVGNITNMFKIIEVLSSTGHVIYN